MDIYTIGFARKTAAEFFGALSRAGIGRVVDVRLHNTSQLAGFTKRDDLAFFLAAICSGSYLHEPLLAPTQEILDRYRKHGGSWSEYERAFIGLLTARRVEEAIDRSLFDRRTVLLCSEPTPEHCHRRLVVEYLAQHWKGVRAVHL